MVNKKPDQLALIGSADFDTATSPL